MIRISRQENRVRDTETTAGAYEREKNLLFVAIFALFSRERAYERGENLPFVASLTFLASKNQKKGIRMNSVSPGR